MFMFRNVFQNVIHQVLAFSGNSVHYQRNLTVKLLSQATQLNIVLSKRSIILIQPTIFLPQLICLCIITLLRVCLCYVVQILCMVSNNKKLQLVVGCMELINQVMTTRAFFESHLVHVGPSSRGSLSALVI